MSKLISDERFPLAISAFKKEAWIALKEILTHFWKT